MSVMLIVGLNLNAQISYSDFNRLMEGVEMKKGVSIETVEWLMNNGFTRTHRSVWDSDITERYSLIEDGGIEIVFNIYDSGKIVLRIDYDKAYNQLYESTKLKIANYKKIGFYESCQYPLVSEEYQMGDYFINFIRGVVSKVNGNYQLGSIIITKYSYYAECQD